MMTRREMNGVLGVSFATLFSGAIATLRAETPTARQDSQEHPATPNAARGVAPLMTQSIGDVGDANASMLILTLEPKHTSTPHRHSGPVFAYVLEGHVENQVDPEEPKKYSAGDYWYEPEMHVHRSFTNLSDTGIAKVLVFMITPKGKPAGLPAQ